MANFHRLRSDHSPVTAGGVREEPGRLHRRAAACRYGADEDHDRERDAFDQAARIYQARNLSVAESLRADKLQLPFGVVDLDLQLAYPSPVCRPGRFLLLDTKLDQVILPVGNEAAFLGREHDRSPFFVRRRTKPLTIERPELPSGPQSAAAQVLHRLAALKEIVSRRSAFCAGVRRHSTNRERIYSRGER